MPPSSSITKSWTRHESNLALLECLSAATPTRPALPVELILQILSHPTRWVRLHSIGHPPITPSVEPAKPILIVNNRPDGIPVLYTRPFSAQEVGRLREVIFKFRSRDQGWSSFGPDAGSFSWFEATLAQSPSTDDDGQGQDNDAVQWTGSYGRVVEWLERHDKMMENQPRYRIQTNRHAETEPEEYTIKLTGDHELVRRVKKGDRIMLWACACFPGWENRVYQAEISVRGMDDLKIE